MPSSAVFREVSPLVSHQVTAVPSGAAPTGHASGVPNTFGSDVPAVAAISQRTVGALVRLDAFHSRTTGPAAALDQPLVASTAPPRLGPSHAVSHSSASAFHSVAWLPGTETV